MKIKKYFYSVILGCVPQITLFVWNFWTVYSENEPWSRFGVDVGAKPCWRLTVEAFWMWRMFKSQRDDSFVCRVAAIHWKKTSNFISSKPTGVSVGEYCKQEAPFCCLFLRIIFEFQTINEYWLFHRMHTKHFSRWNTFTEKHLYPPLVLSASFPKQRH